MFWRNLLKIGQIYIPYKFPQSVCILPKIKCKILTPKGLQTTCATPGDYLASWNCKPIMKDQDFPGSNLLWTLFFSHLNCSVECWGGQHNNEQSCKGKGKTCGKNGKPAKWAERQDNKSTYSFQNYNFRWLLMFLYQGWYLHKEKETFFKHYVWKNVVWQWLLCLKSGHSVKHGFALVQDYDTFLIY